MVCTSRVAGMLLVALHAEAFVSPPYPISVEASSTRGNGPLNSDSGQSGRMERIEFKIFPDGRVEEKVIGVKGESCLEVTREINEKLGNVISTSPTEEMYQEEVQIDQTLYNSNTEGDGASWEGSSSW
eukprot:CAMPEP_0197180552 /NCGR_PEP_ID=MMETSP1423-20130617/5122_1 /TAXON_ID=476441 /ORGANISM="Pseudo-nitzschia heimii, Strain UNC1101" /LENGTH=127 /DNA_ID=CAMNT_0042630647 /DNA_START=147 /DNA_END=530 /DNA_ORIENTATION=+